jgi:hypothetical protein
MSDASNRPPSGIDLDGIRARHGRQRDSVWSVHRDREALLEEVDRLQAAILRHRALVRNGPAWSAANRELWSALDGGA